ncbi:MAG TPA: DUF5018 domain-containing protein [Clostridiaceae bacterium]|nr:DUF5018 domain-containing protein [Clostridiaceae bacterium]
MRCIRKIISALVVLALITTLFQTVTFAAKSDVLENVALGKATSASSEMSGNYASFRAVDGVYHNGSFNPNIEFNLWSTVLGQSTGSWWQVDLGEVLSIQDVKVQYRGVTGTYIGMPAAPFYLQVPESVTFMVSDDGNEWTTIISKSTDVPEVLTPYSPDFYTYSLNTTGRYVRLFFEDGAQIKPGTQTNDVVSLAEVQVMGQKLPSSKKDIVSFSVPGQIGLSVIDADSKIVTFHMPYGSEINALVPYISVSDYAEISPGSGEETDFSAPVTYTVTAQDGTQQEWLAICIVNNIQAVYYVSPDGNDNNPGTENEPFLTIEKAQETVRNINDNMTGDIIVYLRGGEYVIDDTIRFNQEDSGSNGYNIIYKAYPGEKPVIQGGKRVSGWTEVEGAGIENLWKAQVPGIENTRQLYINGIRATRARGDAIVTSGWQYVDDPDMQFNNLLEIVNTYQGSLPVYEGYRTTSKYKDMVNWKNPSDIEFVYDVGWTHCILPVDSITPTEDGTGAIIKMRMPAFRDAQIKGGMHILDPSYIENAYELMDEPGEWYLDRSADELYYIPKPGENMNDIEAIVPVVEKMMEVKGTLDNPVQNILFDGISFEYSTWLRPSNEGQAEIQANFSKDPNENQNMHDCFVKIPSTIVLDAAKGISFERCKFSKLGSGAIDIQNGSSNNLIRGNEFDEIAASAIQVGDVRVADAHPADPREVVKDNVISNNYIHNIGTEYKGSIGVFAGYTDGTVISHNEITDIAYSGISVGWGWGFWDAGGRNDAPAHYPRFSEPTVAKNNVVEYNHIHHVMQKLADGAGIYTLSMMPDTVIRGNLIHDNPGWPGGIYLDEASGGITVTQNIIYNVQLPYFYHDVNIPGRQETCSVLDNYFNVSPSNPAYPVELAAKAGLEPAFEGILPVEIYSISSEPMLKAGDIITIYGTRFGTVEGSVTFTGVEGNVVLSAGNPNIVSWSNTVISCIIPDGVKSGPVYITRADGKESNKDKSITIGYFTEELFNDNYDEYPTGTLVSDKYTFIPEGCEVIDFDKTSGTNALRIWCNGVSPRLIKTASWKNSMLTFNFKINDPTTSYEGVYVSNYFVAASPETMYYLGICPAFTGKNLLIQQHINGAYTEWAGTEKSIDIGKWYSATIVLLDNRMYVKVWPYGEAEPEEWDVESNVSGLNDGGGLQLSFFSWTLKSALFDDVKVMGWEDTITDGTPPVAKLMVDGNILANGESFEDSQLLSIKMEDNLSGIASAQVAIGDKIYKIDKDQNSIEIDLTGKPGQYNIRIIAEDKAGNINSEEFNLSVITSISSIRQLIDRFVNDGRLGGPLVGQLSNSLDQAEHQLKMGFVDHAVKHMKNFMKHLDNKALERHVDDSVKVILSADVNFLIDYWLNVLTKHE